MTEKEYTLVTNWLNRTFTRSYNPVASMNELSKHLEVDIAARFLEPDTITFKLSFTTFTEVLNDDCVQRGLSLDLEQNSLASLELMTAATRLLLCMTYISKFDRKSKALQSLYTNIVPSLIEWTAEAQEPLRTYATGLLDILIKEKHDESIYDLAGPLLKCLMDRLVSNHDPSKYERNVFWKLSPLALNTQQMYIFRILSTLRNTRKHIRRILKNEAMFSVLKECFLGCIKTPSIIGLAKEARSYISLLFKSSKFTLAFFNCHDAMQILLGNLCEPLMFVTSSCLSNLAMNTEAMDHIYLNNPTVVMQLASHVLNFFDNSCNLVRSNAMVFFGYAFRYQELLNFFDTNGGVQKIQTLFDDILKVEWENMYNPLFAFKSYVHAHFALKYHEINDSEPMMLNLFLSNNAVREMLDKLTPYCPFRWTAMEPLAAGFLKIVHGRYHKHFKWKMMELTLQILSIMSLLPEVQMILSNEIYLKTRRTTGFQDIIWSILYDCPLDEETMDRKNDIRNAGLRVLINCLCVPIKKNGDNSLLKNSWKKIREGDGIVTCLGILDPEYLGSDETMSLACKALCGLARDDEVKSIICKIYRDKIVNPFRTESEEPHRLQSQADEYITKLLNTIEPLDVSDKYSDAICTKPKSILSRLDRREKGIESIEHKSDKIFKYHKFRSYPSDRWAVSNWYEVYKWYKFFCVKFSLDLDELIICDQSFTARVYDIYTGELKSSTLMKRVCKYIEFRRSGYLMITNCGFEASIRKSMNFTFSFYDLELEYVQFAHWDQKWILTADVNNAKIIDTSSGIELMRLSANYRNYYRECNATCSIDDRQILYDGVMFDSTTGNNIFKFEKLNKYGNAIFHPNGYEVIINSEIWDLRMRKLIKIQPNFDHKRIIFGSTDNILYAAPNNIKDELQVIDANTYNTIWSQKVARCESIFDVNERDNIIAAAQEQRPGECVVKIYHAFEHPIYSEEHQIIINELFL